MLRTILTQLVLPPAVQILMVLVAVLFWRISRVFAWLCLLLSFLSLLVLSLPVVSAKLNASLERQFEALSADQVASLAARPNTAIVVLGGGKGPLKAEYQRESVSLNALPRLRYGALLAKKTELPVVLTGGNLSGEGESEAELMAQVMQEYAVDNLLLEKQSRNTWENALYSSELLHERGINQVILITQAWHIPRSVYSFRQFGLQVIPAPTMSRAWHPGDVTQYLPSAMALEWSAAAIREWLGLMVYRVFYTPMANKNPGNAQPAKS